MSLETLNVAPLPGEGPEPQPAVMSAQLVPAEQIGDSQMALFEDDLAQPAAEPAPRAIVRVAERVATLADKVGTHMAGRRTTGEVVSDNVERGKQIAANVGNSVVNSVVSTGQTIKTNYNEVKTNGRENIQRFKGFLQGRAEAAKARKNQLFAGLKRGAEAGREVAAKTAHVAGEIGLVAIGLPILGAQAGGRMAKRGAIRGALATERGINATFDKAAEITAATTEAARRRSAAVAGRAIMARSGITAIRANVQGRFAEHSENKVAKHTAKVEARTAKLESSQVAVAARQAKAAELKARATKPAKAV